MIDIKLLKLSHKKLKDITIDDIGAFNRNWPKTKNGNMTEPLSKSLALWSMQFWKITAPLVIVSLANKFQYLNAVFLDS